MKKKARQREKWYPSWDLFDYGPYGNKACNLCERHLECPNENLVFIRKALGEDHQYCISFQLSEAILGELKRRWPTYLYRVKALRKVKKK